jgi:hypothetical protein
MFDGQTELRSYLKVYNNSIPQRALDHQTPIQALKKWHDKKPDLFSKRVYNQAGLDTPRGGLASAVIQPILLLLLANRGSVYESA